MKAIHLPFSAQLGRYKHLAKKVNRLLKEGTFQLLSLKEQRSLLTKLRDRLKRIGQLIPQTQLKGALAGVALLLGTASGLQGQTFAPGVTSPFGIAPGSTYGFQSFADIDGDGDLDLLVNAYDSISYQNNMVFFENLGTAQNPIFSADNFQVNPYGIESGYLTQPILADFDNDGDLDLIAGIQYGGGFQFQENIGTATAPNYSAPQTNPFGLTASYNLDSATAADLDGDGDIDILSGGFYGVLNFFENVGTPESPAFAAPQANPFGIVANGLLAIPHLGDFDSDGDFDLLAMNYDYTAGGTISYAKNSGTTTSPNFDIAVNNPFGITSNGLTVPIPCSADIDGDGDLDVFINDYYGTVIHFYENLTSPSSSTDRSLLANVKLSPNPVSSLLNLHLESNTMLSKPTIAVMDALGRTVSSKMLSIESQTIDFQLDVSQLTSGLYFVKIEADGKASMTKFVKD
ncbi:MAG: T9SS type A sorting domain-containing protein [Saprospiraceae bacterium]|nr:T9SS type A sorting domain-containing protein [Saprospiraceae bacterium]MCF8248897.1 T9SS type A sorting domain-containing protein [Saprospiraceae bacterium]MCF8279622.1 T9SS type A sorting domain-containing protein [Bacteroidales bacterium]MCF8310182.1 T9SS type A sorting domain-containing protein [Saprospiraceae bacterium]MCF8439082.1 T9SS type A sorting domain-containing protein [Saprospiraceae bacterium]